MRPIQKEKRKVIALPDRFAVGFWNDMDGRSVVVREIRRRVELLSADCGADSQQKRIVVQRAVFLDLQLESMECAAVDKLQLESGAYVSFTNALTGILKTLGMDKHIRHAGGLRAYLKEGDPE